LLKDLLLPVVPLNPDSLNPLPHTSSADKLIEKPSSSEWAFIVDNVND
jgi:hypothetical protein